MIYDLFASLIICKTVVGDSTQGCYGEIPITRQSFLVILQWNVKSLVIQFANPHIGIEYNTPLPQPHGKLRSIYWVIWHKLWIW